MIKFRQKQFGILEDTISGAKLGGLIGTGATIIPSFRKGDRNKPMDWNTASALIGGGTVIGAGLGFLVGLIRKSSTKINQSTTSSRNTNI